MFCLNFFLPAALCLARFEKQGLQYQCTGKLSGYLNKALHLRLVESDFIELDGCGGRAPTGRPGLGDKGS